MTDTSIDSFQSLIEIPAEHRKVPINREQILTLRNLITETWEEHAKINSLEIGLAYGVSAAAILLSHQGWHTAIDPNQALPKYANLGEKNLSTLKLRERCRILPLASEFALPTLLQDAESFDFIFIDGGHSFEQVTVDFFFCSRLLGLGGILVLDDLWAKPIRLLVEHIKINRDDFDFVKESANLAIFKKLLDHNPRHYADFCYPKGIVVSDR